MNSSEQPKKPSRIIKGVDASIGGIPLPKQWYLEDKGDGLRVFRLGWCEYIREHELDYAVLQNSELEEKFCINCKHAVPREVSTSDNHCVTLGLDYTEAINGSDKT